MQAEIQGSYYAKATEQEIAGNCPAPATTECVTRVVEASHEQQRSEADLNAQRDMAKWAFATVIISAAGTGVGLLGLWFISDTLKATRKGNKINRQIGQAQVRAYLSFTGISGAISYKTFSIPAKMTAGMIEYEIGAHALNSGNSPARNCFVYIKSEIEWNGVKVSSAIGRADPDIPSGTDTRKFFGGGRSSRSDHSKSEVSVCVTVVIQALDVFGTKLLAYDRFTKRFETDGGDVVPFELNWEHRNPVSDKEITALKAEIASFRGP